MEKDVALDRLFFRQDFPTPSAGSVALGVARARELKFGSSVEVGWRAIQSTLYDNEGELSVTVFVELDETRLNEVEGLPVPFVHLDDPPPAGQLRGGARDIFHLEHHSNHLGRLTDSAA